MYLSQEKDIIYRAMRTVPLYYSLSNPNRVLIESFILILNSPW